MEPKDGNTYIGCRVSPEWLKVIEEKYVGQGKEFENMSDFLRALIQDKIDPKRRREKLKSEVWEILNDPDSRQLIGLPPNPGP